MEVYNPRFHAYVDTSDDHIFSHGDRIRLVGDDSTGDEGNLPLKRRSKAWLQYARRPELLGKTAKELYEGYRLCSEHFTAKDFLDPGKTRLTKTAIPTVRPQMLRPSVTAQEEPVATTCPCDVPLEGNRMSHPTAAYEKPIAEPSPGDVRLEGSRTSPSTAAHEGPMVAPSPGNVPLEGSGTSPLAAAHKQPLAAPSPGNVPLEGSGMSPSTAAREGPMAAPSPGNVPMESSGTSPLAAVHEEPVATCPCDVPLEGSRTSHPTAASEKPMAEPSPGDVRMEGSGTSPSAAAHDEEVSSEENPENCSSTEVDVSEALQPCHRVRCCAHTLQLAVNDALRDDKTVSELLKLLNSIINLFRRSSYWTGRLKEVCKKDVVLASSTRWNSILAALNRLTQSDVYDAVVALVEEYSEDHPSRKVDMTPPLFTVPRLEELQNLLRPLGDATDRLQSDGVTSGMVHLCLSTCYAQINNYPAKE
ncbi:hypothetical protein ISCGN_011546 [Ixodes scapularis]